MIVVTGATGNLGRLVVEGLLKKVQASELAVAVRSPEKAGDLATRGVQVRKADYSKPETLTDAFAGADKVLLISSSEVGQREKQHRAVLDAVKKNPGIRLLVYTSLLHGDSSGISLAPEHKATEEVIRASGIPFVFLRNGWYIENYTENLAPALQNGAFIGCAGEGRIAGATRKDFADAAVVVLTGTGHENKTYELAGDVPFTMKDLAAEVSRQANKQIVYKDLSPEDYGGALSGVGLPPPVVEMLVSADRGIARGELDDSSRDLSRLIGRPTTSLKDAVAAGLSS